MYRRIFVPVDGSALSSLARDHAIALAQTQRGRVGFLHVVDESQRLAAGRYGVCIDCGAAIDYKRLEVYPTAKRCLPCQQHREKTRAPSKYTGR